MKALTPLFALLLLPLAFAATPLEQTKEGVNPLDIQCSNNLVLVLKQSNGNPVCVKPESVEPLISRGWAIHALPDHTPENNNSEIFHTGQYETTSELVQYDQYSGYLSKPTQDGTYPGIVMIHEWWGLNENIKQMSEKLASHGYIVLAVDMYDGQVATSTEDAIQLVRSFDQQRGTANTGAAVSYLKDQHSTPTVGSIGWCFGGAQSLQLAINEQMDATVIYYGQLITEQTQLQSIQWPVLGIFAEQDTGIPPTEVNKFRDSLDALGIQNQITIYPGVDHAFANPSGQRYAPDEAQDAWNKTIEFLQTNL